MKKTGIFFGSTTGTTEGVAAKIAEVLGCGKENIHCAADLTKELAESYDVLVLGSSTWGAGDLQDDWYDAVNVLKSMNLSGKTVALFGCGDSESFSDTFCDAIGILYNELQPTGCTFAEGIGTEGYNFDSSTAVVDGKFLGLALDEVNQPDMTDERIAAWAENVKKHMG